MRFVDTNVLLYAVSEVPEEADKRARAREVLTEPDLAASVQVLQEFYHQATRPTRNARERARVGAQAAGAAERRDRKGG